jgi:ubiquinone/menaquinone biosynthesis C-methylase UbiE
MEKSRGTTEERARFWDSAYASRGVQSVSWYQDTPIVSLELIEALGIGRDAAVVDIGGGASVLVDRLVEQGFVDVSVLDVSADALAEARRRLGDAAPVSWLHEDLRVWRPERRFDLWHDRAVFHFLVTCDDRDRYLQTLRSAIKTNGAVVLATFAADGPEFCSGLPVARYSSADLAHLLGNRFELLETRQEEHTTPAGVMQPFTWVAGRIGPA